MQPRKIALAALLIAPLALTGCSQQSPTPPASRVPNPLLPQVEIVDGIMINDYRDVANIVERQKEKNKTATSKVTMAEYEANKALELLNNAKSAQTILAVRDWLVNGEEVKAMLAKTPKPKKNTWEEKYKTQLDTYGRWLRVAADTKALQFNMREVHKIGELKTTTIDLGPNPPSFEQAKKQTLFYARQIPAPTL